MADILIKGIEMPKDMSNPLHISIFSNGSIWITHEGKTEATAQELPPHGRLIDADKLFNECEQFDLPNIMPDSLWFEANDLRNAPTVIPSSEGE